MINKEELDLKNWSIDHEEIVRIEDGYRQKSSQVDSVSAQDVVQDNDIDMSKVQDDNEPTDNIDPTLAQDPVQDDWLKPLDSITLPDKPSLIGVSTILIGILLIFWVAVFIYLLTWFVPNLSIITAAIIAVHIIWFRAAAKSVRTKKYIKLLQEKDLIKALKEDVELRKRIPAGIKIKKIDKLLEEVS